MLRSSSRTRTWSQPRHCRDVGWFCSIIKLSLLPGCSAYGNVTSNSISTVEPAAFHVSIGSVRLQLDYLAILTINAVTCGPKPSDFFSSRFQHPNSMPQRMASKPVTTGCPSTDFGPRLSIQVLDSFVSCWEDWVKMTSGQASGG